MSRAVSFRNRSVSTTVIGTRFIYLKYTQIAYTLQVAAVLTTPRPVVIAFPIMAPSRLITALSAAVLLAAAPADDAKLLQKARDIHKRIIAFASHADLPFDYP